jgi:hypothetical protein
MGRQGCIDDFLKSGRLRQAMDAKSPFDNSTQTAFWQITQVLKLAYMP